MLEGLLVIHRYQCESWVLPRQRHLWFILTCVAFLEKKGLSATSHLSWLFSRSLMRMLWNTEWTLENQNTCNITKTSSPLKKRIRSSFKDLLASHVSLLKGNKWQMIVRERKREVPLRECDRLVSCLVLFSHDCFCESGRRRVGCHRSPRLWRGSEEEYKDD